MDNFQIIHFHQPVAVNNLSFLDIGKNLPIINEEENSATFESNYKTTILPKLRKVIKMAEENKNPLVFFSLSFLKVLQEKEPDILEVIQEKVASKELQLIGSCAYHSFSYLSSPILFEQEAKLYLRELEKFFSSKPGIFINTACLFDDQIAYIIQKLGYKSAVATANSWHLAGKHSGQVYRANTKSAFSILLSNGDSHDNFQISLINGYGSAYSTDYIDQTFTNEKQIQELFMLDDIDKQSVYSVTMPLSSPSWEYKIPDYTNNPLQKALLKQIALLMEKHADQLSEEDLHLLMLLCQPDHLLNINQTSKEEGYEHFISSMNWLTSISLRYH